MYGGKQMNGCNFDKECMTAKDTEEIYSLVPEKEKNDVIISLSSIYSCNYYFNLYDYRYVAFKQMDDVREVIPDEGYIMDYFLFYEKYLIDSMSVEEFKEFTDVTTLKERLRNINSISLEFKRIHYGWCRGSFIVVKRDADNNAAAVVYVGEIIDARKQKELEYQRAIIELSNKKDIELKETSLMLEQIVKSLNCGIFAYTLPDRRILQINDEAKRLFDWDVNEANKNEFVDSRTMGRIVPRDYAHVAEAVKKLRKEGDSVEYEYRLIKSDGSIIKVQVHTKLLQNEEGERFILSSMLDITEKSQMQDMLKQERMQYRDALLNNSEYAYTFDLTYGYLENEFVLNGGLNPIKELGLTLPVKYDEYLFKWAEKYKPQFLNGATLEEMTSDYYIRAFKQGQRYIETEYLAIESGTYRRRSTLLSVNEQNGHILACVVAKDITRAREKEEETKKALKNAYDAANQASLAKSDFLSRMSHDIRTPMNAIIGMTAIAEANIDDSERLKDCLSKINVSSRHLLKLINEVLDMSKIESGRVELLPERFDLTKLMSGVVTIINTSAASRKHTFTLDMQVANRYLIGDMGRIEQICMNILGNSIKYTPEGGNLKLTVSEHASNIAAVHNYKFVFEDNGMGMTREFVDRIFEPFSRAEDTRINKIQGTGLGMSIVKSIVQMMGGDISVESEYGRGSKFTVTIPLRLQDNNEIKAAAYSAGVVEINRNPAEQVDKNALKGKRILLVEDNELNSEIAIELLASEGFQIEHASDGVEAVDMFGDSSEGYYDLILMDIQMPVMNGYEATRAIRALGKKDAESIPIIAMTANAFVEDIENARNAGMNEHMAKPINVERLFGLLQKWIK